MHPTNKLEGRSKPVQTARKAHRPDANSEEGGEGSGAPDIPTSGSAQASRVFRCRGITWALLARSQDPGSCRTATGLRRQRSAGDTTLDRHVNRHGSLRFHVPAHDRLLTSGEGSRSRITDSQPGTVT